MEPEEVIDPGEILILGVLQVGFMMGVVIFAGVVVMINHLAPEGAAGIPEHLRILTWAVAGLSLAALAASRALFGRMLASAAAASARAGGRAENLKAAVRAAYIVKAALLEGPALLGLVTLLLIALLPCDIWRAPAFYRLNWIGPAVFLLEMALAFPTPGRIDFALRSLSPEARRPHHRDR